MGVVDKVGSGKSSFLAAITAEMRRKDGQVSIMHVGTELVQIEFTEFKEGLDSLC